MGCDTCIFLNNVRSLAVGKDKDDQKGVKLEPCSMMYGCNPYFKEGKDLSVLISESYCGTCTKLAKECECAEGIRQIRHRKVQVPKNRN